MKDGFKHKIQVSSSILVIEWVMVSLFNTGIEKRIRKGRGEFNFEHVESKNP